MTLTFTAGGLTYGPLTETSIIASGSLTGTVYYNSYGTSLVQNFCCAQDGSQFGGATPRHQRGGDEPGRHRGHELGTAAAPDQSGCRVCHAVSANGSSLITQHGDNYAFRASTPSRRATPRRR